MIEDPTYRLRLSRMPEDLARVEDLRTKAFGPAGAADRFDARADQMLVERSRDDGLVAALRLLTLADGRALDHCYSALFYDLSPFRAATGPLVEIGRFCQSATDPDPAILRLAFLGLTRHVLDSGVTMFLGCASFRGAEPARHLAALSALRAGHLLPAAEQPGLLAAETFSFATNDLPQPDPRGLPPLLRSYLALGGRTSDHAVIDRELDTLHVFTALKIAEIPPGRARLLTRASAT